MLKKYQLKNGMKVIVKPSSKSPVVSLQVWVNTGSADEPSKWAGISHFIEHLVFKGTTHYGPGEIASVLEGCGGELNAYTSFDQTVFYVNLSKEFASTGLNCLYEMMTQPLFDKKEIDAEREVVIEEIKRGLDSPHRQASQMLFSTCYPQHEYGRPVIGFEEIVRNVSVADIKKYFSGRYNPAQMTLVVVGDVSEKDFLKEIDSKFGAEKKQKTMPLKRKSFKPNKTQKIRVEYKTFEETIGYCAWPIPKTKSKDIPGLEVLALILGQGESSRLNQALRMDKTLVNSIGSGMFTGVDEGQFVISMTLNSSNIKEATQEMLKTVEKIRNELVSPLEIQKALTQFASDQYYALETVEGMARRVGSDEFYYKDPEAFQKILKQISSIQPKDLLKLAKKYLDPNKTQMILMTNSENKNLEKELKSELKNFEQLSKKTNKTKAAPAAKSKKLEKINVRWSPKKKSTATTIETHKLVGGGQLILRPAHDTPVISLKSAFRGGSRVETDKNQGLVEWLTRSWVGAYADVSEITVHESLEKMASSISAFGGRNTFGLNMTTLAPMFNRVFDLYRGILTSATFEKDILDREKLSMLEQIRTKEDHPAQRCIQFFMEELFTDHPYAKDPLGTKGSVEALTKKDIESYLGRFISMSNFTAVVSGDFDKGKILEGFQEIAKQMDNKKVETSLQKFIPPKQSKKRFVSSSKEQTNLVVGFPSYTLDNPKKYALQVMQAILAGQGGRLFIELRDKNSLAYSVSPLRMEGLDAGYFGAYIGCSPEKGAQALRQIREEFDKLTQIEVGVAELERAKRYLIGRHDLDLQKNSAVAGGMLFEAAYGRNPEEIFKFPEHISAVHSKDVMAVAKEIFSGAEVCSAVGKICPWE